METTIGVLGLIVAMLGLLLAWRSRSDQLLREIRDVLIAIHRKL